MIRVAALGAVAVLAGCGATRSAGPHLPRTLAAAWRSDADAVAEALAAGDRCLARQRAVALQTSVIRAVNAHRLGSQFQEPLVGAVNELASRVRCAE